MHKLILTCRRSLIHFTFLFYSHKLLLIILSKQDLNTQQFHRGQYNEQPKKLTAVFIVTLEIRHVNIM